MAMFAMGFIACTKKDDGFLQIITPPPTSNIAVRFYPDSSVLSQTIQAPKNNQLIFSSKVYTGTINGFTLTSVKVVLKKSGDAAEPYEYLRRVRLIVDGNFSGVPLTLIKDSVSSNEFTFSNFATNFGPSQLGTVKLYGDVLSSATNNTGVEDNLVVSVTLTYSAYNGTSTAFFQIGSVDGHKTVFSSVPQSFTVTSVADPLTPVSGIILQGEDKKTFSYSVNIMGVSGSVTEHRLLVQGLAANAVTKLKLYDGNNNFIAQADVINGVATIITNDAISAGMQKAYSIRPVVNVNSGDVSNNDFIIVLDAIKAVSTANETKTDGTDRTGNSFTALKAMLEVKKVNVPTLVITNNSMMDLYTVDLTAINGDVSLKELAYLISLDDQSNNDSLLLKNFQVLDENGIDITNQFRFTDAACAIDTLFSESDTKLRSTRIAGTGETVIPAGVTKRLIFRAFLGGFNHPLDGDGFSVIPASDAITSTGLKYLNTGGLTSGNIKLYSNPAASTNAQNFNWVWSDKSSPNHYGQPSQNSQSNDWIGGQRISFVAVLTVNNFHQ